MSIPPDTTLFSAISQIAETCTYLQTVYLRRCLNITDDAVVALSRSCPQLRYLNLGGCHQITDRALQALGQYSKYLRSVNLSHTKVSFFDCFCFNPFLTIGFSHSYYLGESILILRGFRCDFKILIHFWMKFLQANRISPDGTPHIWGYSVCLCPTKRVPGIK